LRKRFRQFQSPGPSGLRHLSLRNQAREHIDLRFGRQGGIIGGVYYLEKLLAFSNDTSLDIVETTRKPVFKYSPIAYRRQKDRVRR